MNKIKFLFIFPGGKKDIKCLYGNIWIKIMDKNNGTVIKELLNIIRNIHLNF